MRIEFDNKMHKGGKYKMKKKKLISVITLIITGLFLTSITGMSVFTQKNAMTENTVTDFLQMQDESIHSTSGLADPPQSPSTPIYAADGAHVHDHPNDMNKGIGIRCIWNPIMGLPQTFTTTSNNSGDNIFYKIFFGDGQDSGWLGPFSTGQVSSAVHDYAAIGNFSVTAVCRMNGMESRSSDPTIVQMYYLGDTRGNNGIGYDDIGTFVLQISGGKNSYYNGFPLGYFYTGDLSNDGLVNFSDINSFVTLLSGGCPQ